jgi:beta-glucosidase
MAEFYQFPKDFHWGTATAAYQIEGAVNRDGRGPSIWDIFSHTPGATKKGDTGDIACDHYHHWKEDIQLMKTLGCKAYRFSVAWPRILPDGIGKVNQSGVDFYNHLIDEMLQAGITPMLTLYHWDLPARLKDGWLNRSTADAFAEYSVICAKFFGDRVKYWATINEPMCASFMGYSWGHHAPGINDPYKGLVAAHHILLAHGKAVTAIHSVSTDAQVGIPLNLMSIYPQTSSDEDQTAARIAEGLFNRWFIDPIYKGAYPVETVQEYVRKGVLKDENLDFVKENDMQTISVPMDYLGLNYYTRQVYHVEEGQDPAEIHIHQLPAPADNQTEMGWEIYPKGFYDLLIKVNEEYHPKKIMITENGASYSTAPDANGKVNDVQRIRYLDLHLQTIAKAIQAGVPVAGYYLWSLMDNFEWGHGYSQRFGMVYVDYKTQKRYPKESAYWYRDVIKQNGLSLE